LPGKKGGEDKNITVMTPKEKEKFFPVIVGMRIEAIGRERGEKGGNQSPQTER